MPSLLKSTRNGIPVFYWKRRRKDIIREADFHKTIQEITAKDRKLYEQMPTLPDGIILIDLNNPSNFKSGHVCFHDSAKNIFVSRLKEICKEKEKMTKRDVQTKDNDV